MLLEASLHDGANGMQPRPPVRICERDPAVHLVPIPLRMKIVGIVEFPSKPSRQEPAYRGFAGT